MDWNDFADRLTLELSRLPVRSFLIVQDASGLPYVQAMRSEGVLDAEAAGSAFLPRPLAPPQERRLRALGWEPPDGAERRNWWRSCRLRDRGARASEENLEACALLSGLLVGAFRDVYGVGSPVGLVYQAERIGAKAGPIALPGLGLAPAVPENEAERPARPRVSGHGLEAALTRARGQDDQQAYLELLDRAVLYLPALSGPGDDHQFATAQFGEGTFILAFTSPEALDRSLQGQAVHHREVPLADLVHSWPHPAWRLAVNPGLPSACYLDPHAIVADEPQRPTESDHAPPAGDGEVVIMQKVLRDEHARHYLDDGYDLVTGNAHRLRDVRELTTPEALARGLGLPYGGSPADEKVFVIRWATAPSLLLGAGDAPGEGVAIPEFTIESQRLPHGAELLRVDASGTASLVAVYDAGLRGWDVRGEAR